MRSIKYLSKKPAKTLIILAVILAALIGVVSLALLFSSMQASRSQRLVQQEMADADTVFRGELASLGISGTPTLTSTCETNPIGSSLMTRELDCQSSLLYPTNYSHPLTPLQVSQYQAAARRLDASLVQDGWYSGKGPQAFANLPIAQFAASSSLSAYAANADYFKETGRERGDGDQCSLIVSLTRPTRGEIHTGAVLNVVSFSCARSTTYLHLTL